MRNLFFTSIVVIFAVVLMTSCHKPIGYSKSLTKITENGPLSIPGAYSEEFVSFDPKDIEPWGVSIGDSICSVEYDVSGGVVYGMGEYCLIYYVDTPNDGRLFFHTFNYRGDGKREFSKFYVRCHKIVIPEKEKK